jgi:hypothetical protein
MIIIRYHLHVRNFTIIKKKLHAFQGEMIYNYNKISLFFHIKFRFIIILKYKLIFYKINIIKMSRNIKKSAYPTTSDITTYITPPWAKVSIHDYK